MPLPTAAKATTPGRAVESGPVAEPKPAPEPAAQPAPAPADTRPAPALTGADLAAFRRRAGLTQVAAAQRLGVTQGTISKAEGNPRTVLGPALQEALRLAAG
jgi:DNA-binding XRE family transcriptional regulator